MNSEEGRDCVLAIEIEVLNADLGPGDWPHAVGCLFLKRKEQFLGAVKLVDAGQEDRL